MINTRQDLDALVGTDEYAEFMRLLAGSLWRLEKDDEAKCWRVVEDDSTIQRFGFVRADFSGASPPTAPEYVTAVIVPICVSPWQVRKALNQLSLREAVESAVAASDDYNIKDAWQYAQEFVEDDPLVIKLCAAIGKTDAQRHALFVLAEAL